MLKNFYILVVAMSIMAGSVGLAKSLPLQTAGGLSAYEEEAKRVFSTSQVPDYGDGLSELVHDATNSEAVTAERIKIAKDLGVDADALAPHIEANQEREEYTGKNILVFISSSMPQATITNLYQQLGDRDDVVFLMRGFIGDPSTIKPTQEWVKAILCPGRAGEEPARCHKAPLDINPVFFERMAISEVPAIAYVPDPTSLLTTCTEGSGDFYTFFGDFSPSYALERIGAVIPEDGHLKAILDSMRQTFHEGAGK